MVEKGVWLSKYKTSPQVELRVMGYDIRTPEGRDELRATLDHIIKRQRWAKRGIAVGIVAVVGLALAAAWQGANWMAGYLALVSAFWFWELLHTDNYIKAMVWLKTEEALDHVLEFSAHIERQAEDRLEDFR